MSSHSTTESKAKQSVSFVLRSLSRGLAEMQNATPAGVAYQPGQGLDRKALQRLLDRKARTQSEGRSRTPLAVSPESCRVPARAFSRSCPLRSPTCSTLRKELGAFPSYAWPRQIAKDRSKQWEGLIGSGKKKLRCSQCTRPVHSAQRAKRSRNCREMSPRASTPSSIQLKSCCQSPYPKSL